MRGEEERKTGSRQGRLRGKRDLPRRRRDPRRKCARHQDGTVQGGAEIKLQEEQVSFAACCVEGSVRPRGRRGMRPSVSKRVLEPCPSLLLIGGEREPPTRD